MLSARPTRTRSKGGRLTPMIGAFGFCPPFYVILKLRGRGVGIQLHTTRRRGELSSEARIHALPLGVWPPHAARLARVARHLRAARPAPPRQTVQPAPEVPTRTSVKQAEGTVYHTPRPWSARTSRLGRGDRAIRPRALPARGLRRAALHLHAGRRRAAQAELPGGTGAERRGSTTTGTSRGSGRGPTCGRPPPSAPSSASRPRRLPAARPHLRHHPSTALGRSPAPRLAHLSTSSDRQGWDGPGWEKASTTHGCGTGPATLPLPARRLPEALPLAVHFLHQRLRHAPPDNPAAAAPARHG